MVFFWAFLVRKMSLGWILQFPSGNCDRRRILAPSEPDPSQGSFLKGIFAPLAHFFAFWKKKYVVLSALFQKAQFCAFGGKDLLTQVLAGFSQIQSPR